MAATQIVPQVVPFPQSVPAKLEVITQDRLTQYKSLEQRIEAVEGERKQLESDIFAALEAGVAVEPGLLTALLKTTERRSVPWKQVCERELGEDYCKRVLAATKPDKFTRLVVEA
jgi:hypothetical protein